MKNKKIIFGLIFGILVLSIFVYAFRPTVTEEETRFKIVMPVEKGWNLLPSHIGSLWSLHDSPDMTIKEENIKAIFLYLPVHNEYVEVKSGMTEEDINFVPENMDYLKSSAEWYYFDKAGNLLFSLYKTPLQVKLNQGWNLMAVPPQFNYELGWGNLNWGNCDVEKIYLWNPGAQDWMLWEGSPSKTPAQKILDEVEDLAGHGIAVKVKSDCNLAEGSESGEMPGVPSIPE